MDVPTTAPRHRGASLSHALSALLLSLVGGHASQARAEAGMHTFRLEGGAGLALTQPPVDRFDVGGGGALSYELRPAPWVGIELRFSTYILPSSGASPTGSGFGTYFAPSLGLRLHPLATLNVPDLWLDGVGAVVFTGDVIRPGVEIGLGYEFDVAWWLRMGPFLRYHHVFATAPGELDGGFGSVGLTFAFGGDETIHDRDGDGLIDSEDRCPSDAEDMDHFEDADGCPDRDNDGDTVPDTQDACPNDAEDRDGFEDADGCPDTDNDQDHILDGADHCPMVAEDLDQFQDDDGCPDLDNDSDGIADTGDRCPNEPETRNGFEDEDGCPDVPPVVVPPPSESEVLLRHISERIQFPHNQVRVLASSRVALREVIALLRAHPEIIRITVNAYASREGEEEANMALSQRRADAIRTALIRGGINARRVVARAFGEQAPEVEGNSEEELAANRRVVFTLENEVSQ